MRKIGDIIFFFIVGCMKYSGRGHVFAKPFHTLS